MKPNGAPLGTQRARVRFNYATASRGLYWIANKSGRLVFVSAAPVAWKQQRRIANNNIDEPAMSLGAR